MYLVDELGDALKPEDHAFRRDLIHPEEAIGLALHFMTHKGEANTTAEIFSRGAATVSKWVDKFCSAVVQKWGAGAPRADRKIVLPDLAETIDLCERTLEARGLPGCPLGAITFCSRCLP